MKKRTPLILALIIILPILLLGWLGVRLQLDQQQVAAYQQNSLAQSQLRAVDQQLQQHFSALQSLLIVQAEILSGNGAEAYKPEALRQFVGRSFQVEQMFVMTSVGERIFPPRQQPLTQKERDFVSMTRPLLASPERFTQPTMDPIAAPAADQRVTSGRLQSDAARESLYSAPAALSKSEPELRELASGPSYGWLAWYAESGLKHIFWWQDKQGNTLGFALNPARLMSDLINLLPDTQGVSSGLEHGEIVLINDRDEVAYSWGGYQHNEGVEPLRILPLSHPLASWRLSYYNDPAQTAGSGWIGLLLLLLLVALVLSGLGYYLYREHSRELRQAEQRVNFVNQVSHELKTPLTNIRLYAEMLEQSPAINDESQVKNNLGVISSESQRLSRLIDNVLSFGRSQRQGLQLHYRTGQLDQCIAQVVQAFEPILSARGMQVRFRGEAGQNCQLDAEAVEQILNNLLSNCEKYAASGEYIDISSWQEQIAAGYTSWIRVRDYGPGLAEEQREQVFTPFYRVSNKLTDGITGTGIGLGLARELARLHGGDLVAESPEDRAGGVSFLLSLNTPPENTEDRPG